MAQPAAAAPHAYLPRSGSPDYATMHYDLDLRYRVATNRLDATATIRLTEREVVVRFQRRAHNPLLLGARFAETDVAIPWLGKKRLRIELG